MTILTKFRLGIIVGVFSVWGITDILNGLEFILFGEFFIEWDQQLAILMILLGTVYLTLAICMTYWSSQILTALSELFQEY